MRDLGPRAYCPCDSWRQAVAELCLVGNAVIQEDSNGINCIVRDHCFTARVRDWRTIYLQLRAFLAGCACMSSDSGCLSRK